MHKYTSAIIAAAGSGTRMNSDIPKQFILLDGKPVLAHTVMKFQLCDAVDEIIIVTSDKDLETVNNMLSQLDITKPYCVVRGGDTRQHSIYNALCAVKGELVLIHDGARPFVTPKQISDVAEALYENDAAALGIPVTDTIKTVENGYITGTVDRSALVSIQTPQGFKTEIIKKAHEIAKNNGLSVTDDCALCENIGINIKVVCGSPSNIKLTTPDDLKLAKAILDEEKEN